MHGAWSSEWACHSGRAVMHRARGFEGTTAVGVVSFTERGDQSALPQWASYREQSVEL